MSLSEPNTTKMANFIFPLQNKEEVDTFIKSISPIYSIPIPLPKTYCNFNYTDLPDLPEDAKLVTHVNMTIPISTSKELSIAAKALYEHYYFHTIPQSWINIEKKRDRK